MGYSCYEKYANVILPRPGLFFFHDYIGHIFGLLTSSEENDIIFWLLVVFASLTKSMAVRLKLEPIDKAHWFCEIAACMSKHWRHIFTVLSFFCQNKADTIRGPHSLIWLIPGSDLTRNRQIWLIENISCLLVALKFPTPLSEFPFYLHGYVELCVCVSPLAIEEPVYWRHLPCYLYFHSNRFSWRILCKHALWGFKEGVSLKKR